jgi:hypothetical protein
MSTTQLVRVAVAFAAITYAVSNVLLIRDLKRTH